MILAGDVGGTKTVISLWERGPRGLEEHSRRVYASAEHGGLEELLEAGLAAAGGPQLEAVAFGVAGPVIDGRVTTTNLPWPVIEAAALARVAGAPVRLLNDLEAAAYGMLELAPDELVELNPQAAPPREGNAAVIAAGTGLGEAYLVWDGERHRAMAGEGGHATLAPRREEEVALLRFLEKRRAGHVSWERVLSGPGLFDLYGFVRESSGEPEPESLRRRLADEDPAAVVTELGLERADSVCGHALELFVGLYAAEAGNMALRCMAVGGVFIGGGIAPRILPALRSASFMEAFADKGRFSDALRRMPVRVALDVAAPLRGAARIAAELAVRS